MWACSIGLVEITGYMAHQLQLKKARRRARTRYCAGLLALLCGGAAVHAAATTQPDIEQLQDQLRKLQAKVDALEAKTSPAPTTSDYTDAMHSVLKQADDQSEFVNGYDPSTGFILQSQDGNFSMRPMFLLQARYDGAYRRGIPPGGGGAAGGEGADKTAGFELTRVRFILAGNAFSPELTYYFQVADDASFTGVNLLDAYVQYRVSPQSPLALRFGQFKDFEFHENNLACSDQMAVESSLAARLLTGSPAPRVQGVALVYDQDRLRGEVAYHDGYNSANTPFGTGGGTATGTQVTAASGVTPTNWGTSVRAEYLVIGDRTPDFNPYSEYDQFSARGDRQDILVAGAGGDYSEAGPNKIIFHTVDAQYDTATGWGFYGAYLGVYRNLHDNQGITPGSYYDNAFVLQASYMLNHNTEPFLRYDYTHLDASALPGIITNGNIHEITLGVNYYLYGQNAKFTLDGTWLPHGSPTDISYADILQDPGHNEFLFRAQFQLSL